MKSRIAISDQENQAGSIDQSTLAHSIELFRAHGAIWIENLLTTDLVDELRQAYQLHYSSQRVSSLKRKYAIVGDHRFMITVRIEPPFNDPELFANPLLMPILKGLVGEQLQLSSFGSVVTFPGADAQPIHFDHPPLFEDERTCCELPTYAVTVVVPLIDLNEKTGTTAIWEGSHQQVGSRSQLKHLMEQPDWSDAVLPDAKIGDVYLMDYRVIHGGTANRSEMERPILYLVYGRPWFRDAFNFRDQPPVDISQSELKRIPQQYRCLFSSALSDSSHRTAGD